MVKIKATMKGLFGLRDKEGQEYELIIDDTTGQVILCKPIITQIVPTDSDPRSGFKIGDWVIIADVVSTMRRIKKFWKEIAFDDKGLDIGLSSGFYHLATQAQIIEYLTEEAKKRYENKKARCLTTDRIIKIDNFTSNYYGENASINPDSLFINLYRKEMPICVYQRGQWAQIVPDKKLVPKTKSEFIMEWTEWIHTPRSNYSFESFINQFED
jgi:hypothetical protein